MFEETYKPYGKKEYKVTGNKNTKTGNSRADMVLFNKDPDKYSPSAVTVEVYEIKPITQKNTGAGNTQRYGYIKGLESMGYKVSQDGTTFNPNGVTIPRPFNPGQYIRYYTFANQPGMIYYGHVKKPAYEYEKVTAKELAMSEVQRVLATAFGWFPDLSKLPISTFPAPTGDNSGFWGDIMSGIMNAVNWLKDILNNEKCS